MGVMEIEKTAHDGVLILTTRLFGDNRDFFSEGWNREALCTRGVGVIRLESPFGYEPQRGKTL